MFECLQVKCVAIRVKKWNDAERVVPLIDASMEWSSWPCGITFQPQDDEIASPGEEALDEEVLHEEVDRSMVVGLKAISGERLFECRLERYLLPTTLVNLNVGIDLQQYQVVTATGLCDVGNTVVALEDEREGAITVSLVR